MPTTVAEKTQTPDAIDARFLSRILEEGYGPGAWHGNDMRAAVADVSAEDAFWRPQPERHNIAELALHHTISSARYGLNCRTVSRSRSCSKAKTGSSCRTNAS